jgi:hypothetical protein
MESMGLYAIWTALRGVLVVTGKANTVPDVSMASMGLYAAWTALGGVIIRDVTRKAGSVTSVPWANTGLYAIWTALRGVLVVTGKAGHVSARQGGSGVGARRDVMRDVSTRRVTKPMGDVLHVSPDSTVASVTTLVRTAVLATRASKVGLVTAKSASTPRSARQNAPRPALEAATKTTESAISV